MRNILPFKYYAIDANRMRQIVQLNCQLLNDVSYVERGRVTPALTSDYDDCESNISNRCGRSRERSFQVNEESLFLKYIYSTFYNIFLKRYLTFFAVKRDVFHAFFGLEEDDLDQQSLFETFQDDHRRYQKENVHISDSKTQPAGHRLLNVSEVGEDIVSEQGHDDRLNSNDSIKPIPLSRGSMLSPAVPVSSISPVESAPTTLIPYVPPLDVN